MFRIHEQLFIKQVVDMQGYLLKQGVKGIRKSFKKRWFKLRKGVLYYYVHTNSKAEKGSVDLKKCKFVVTLPDPLRKRHPNATIG